MSLSSQCAEAVDRLIEQGTVFTEIDVVNGAGKAHGWSDALYRKALRDANTIVGRRFRERKLGRYGPVRVPDHGLDFARIATKIAYASAETGPKVFVGPNGEKCPNGKFPMILLEDVPPELNRQGKRAGAKRNDLQPWKGQEISGLHVVDAAVVEEPTAPHKIEKPDYAVLERRNMELEANLEAANKRIRELEAELDRVREHKIEESSADVLDLIAELDERLRMLEEPERVAS